MAENEATATGHLTMQHHNVSLFCMAPGPNWSIRGRFIVDGKALSDARIAANISMEEVAGVLGCNKSSVSRWEQGRLVPSEERITKMAEMYGTWAFVKGNPTYGKDTRRKANGRTKAKLSV